MEERFTAHYDEISTRHLHKLFADNPSNRPHDRGLRPTSVIDYSSGGDRRSVAGLLDLARVAKVEKHRDAMFAGKRINTTEDRAVLHVALRMPPGSELHVDGQDVVGDVRRVLGPRWATSPTASGTDRGPGDRQADRRGRERRIGGSDLGPAMATLALADYALPGLAGRFVSNVDPVDLYAATHDLDPATTLFVISSKNFTSPRDADQRRRGPGLAPGRTGQRHR